MKQTILFYKNALYKFILAILVCIALIWPAGCKDVYRNDYANRYNSPLFREGERLKNEAGILANESHFLQKDYNALNERHNAFVAGLSGEELKVYEKYISSAQTNLAAWELNRRALNEVLTKENAQIFATLRQEVADLEAQRNAITERIEMHNHNLALHNQNLQAYQQELAQKQRARQAFGQAIQQASQDYYNRQQEAYKDYNQRSMMQFDLQESQRRQTNRLLNAMRGY